MPEDAMSTGAVSSRAKDGWPLPNTIVRDPGKLILWLHGPAGPPLVRRRQRINRPLLSSLKNQTGCSEVLPQEDEGRASKRSKKVSLDPSPAHIGIQAPKVQQSRFPGISSTRVPAINDDDQTSSDLNVVELSEIPQLNFQIPKIREILKMTFESFLSGCFLEIPTHLYPTLVAEFGGSERLADEAFGFVSKGVARIQGMRLSPNLLSKAQLFQRQMNSENWAHQTGYLAFVTDDRLIGYLRLYVGQSRHPVASIKSHINSISHGAMDKLLYFICQRGNTDRSINFLPLWTLLKPSRIEEDQYEKYAMLMNSILEQAFCTIFQTLGSKALDLPDELGNAALNFSDLGLNILPPIYQGFSVSETIKIKFYELKRESPDPEIREFIRYRRQRSRELRLRCSQPPLPPECYHATLQNLVSGLVPPVQYGRDLSYPVPQDPSAGQQQCFDQATHHDLQYFGNSKASIGIVLGTLDADWDRQSFPWELGSMGFEQSNSLIWRCHASRPHEHHSQILDSCSIRVALLCGAVPIRTVVETIRNQQSVSGLTSFRGPFTIELRGSSIQVWMHVEQDRLRRLFIASPEPIACFFSDWKLTRRVVECFNLAKHLTGMPEIRSTLLQRIPAYIRISQLTRAERDLACPKTTLANLPFEIREWLTLKGFIEDESISRLEKAAGSIIRGCRALLHILQKDPRPTSNYDQNVFARAPIQKLVHGQRQSRSRVPDTGSGAEDLDESTLSAVRRLISSIDILEEEQAISKLVLEIVQQETDIPKRLSANLDDIAYSINNDMIQISNHRGDGKIYGDGHDAVRFRTETHHGDFIHQLTHGPGLEKVGRMGTSFVNERITVGDIQFTLTLFPDDTIRITAELAEEGTTHPECVLDTRKAKWHPDDSARRLALRYSGSRASGQSIQGYLKHTSSYKYICKMNTLADRCLGVPLKLIQQRMRRFVRTTDGRAYFTSNDDDSDGRQEVGE